MSSFGEFDQSLAWIHKNPSANAQPTLAPFSSAQLQAFGTALVDGFLSQVLLAITGVLGPTVSAALGLTQWANELAADASNALATANGANTTATTAQNNWITFLEGIGLSPTEVSSLTSWWNGLWAWITGSPTQPALTSGTAAPSITNSASQAQTVPNFPNAASVQGGGTGWSWNSAISYNNSGGSVQFSCTGVQGQLEGVLFPVQPGQYVTLSAELQWSGVTATGSPFQLQLVPYNGTTPGTPITVAQITSPGINSPGWTQPTPVTSGPVNDGVYTVPPSGVTNAQMMLTVLPSATTGTVYWSGCTDSTSGGYLPTIQANLAAVQQLSNEATAALTTMLQSWGSAVSAFFSNYNWTTLFNSFSSALTTYWTTVTELDAEEVPALNQLFQSLLGINPSTGLTDPASVAGPDGAATLVDTFDNMWNQSISALGGDLSAIGLSGFAQALSSLAISPTSPMANVVSVAQANNQTLAIVDNCPISAGLESTVESNGPSDFAASLSSAQVTQTASRGTCITMSQAKTLGFVQWFGVYTAAPTGFVINFYQQDSSGDLTYLFSSPDLSGTISASGVPWYLWDIPTASQITVTAGDVIAVEFQIETSGAVNAWGFMAPQTTPHPSASTKYKGFSQNWAGAPASTISAASIGWAQAAPYVGVGVGTVPATPFFPQMNYYTIVGTFTHEIPVWANLIDVVGLGGGGGGQGDTLSGNGSGGAGGSWATQTLVVGTDITVGGTITITVEAGGAGGAYSTPGSAGGPTTFSWVNPTTGPQTLVAAGGLGGQPSVNNTSTGLSPGNETFGAAPSPYPGGGAVTGTPGGFPGGGGAGGTLGEYGFAGASGEAWIYDYQS